MPQAGVWAAWAVEGGGRSQEVTVKCSRSCPLPSCLLPGAHLAVKPCVRTALCVLCLILPWKVTLHLFTMTEASKPRGCWPSDCLTASPSHVLAWNKLGKPHVCSLNTQNVLASSVGAGSGVGHYRDLCVQSPKFQARTQSKVESFISGDSLAPVLAPSLNA